MKPFNNENHIVSMEKLISLQEARSKGLEIRKSIIGDSKKIRQVWNMVETFALSDVTILLEGETGTGKELFARAIHEMSDKRNGSFCPIDCSSLPETLLESEIFGYEKGTFTGATERKPGRFELVKGGTLFLDEISNFSPNIQTKLLRVIQERKFYPLGSRNLKPIDFEGRIVTATNQSLTDAIRKGIFREDLFYRLSAVTIQIPPLREREDDIKLLVQHFITAYSERFSKNIYGISPDALAILESHNWPGNVRELENVIKYSALSAVGIIMPWHLPDYLRDTICSKLITTADEKSLIVPAQQMVEMDKEIHIMVDLRFNLEESRDLKRLASRAQEEVERKIVCEVMKKMNLNKSQLARFLGIDCKTLRVKLKRLNH
ncbi:MAG TPA: sigma-54 dependent transcriptional regulator [Thermodesulfobacteriota bacterium]|nr:sigma-54 dependent transcriptional regulator [Thermodesulfobacteriota bacterium]